MTIYNYYFLPLASVLSSCGGDDSVTNITFSLLSVHKVQLDCTIYHRKRCIRH